MNRETLETIVRHAENTVSKDASRYHLSFVKITRIEREKLKIESTDGFIMSTSVLIDSDTEVFTDLKVESVYFEAAFVKPLKAALKDSKGLNEFYLKVESGVLTLNILTYRGRFETNVNYPSFAGIKPTGEIVNVIHFNVEYLNSLFKSLKEDKKQTSVSITCYGGNKPLLITVYDTETTSEGLLMPLKGKE